MKVVLALLILVIVTVAGKVGVAKMHESSLRKKEEAAAELVLNARLASQVALRANILKSLKDPASAQWQNEVLSADQATQCGEVNAKNSLGGYVGFKRYISNPKGYLIQGSGFGTWSMTDNRTPVPDYMIKGAQLSDAGDITFTRDVFNFFWESNCI